LFCYVEILRRASNENNDADYRAHTKQHQTSPQEVVNESELEAARIFRSAGYHHMGELFAASRKMWKTPVSDAGPSQFVLHIVPR
jgi:hypothetical protein